MLRIIHLSDLHLHASEAHPDNRNAFALAQHVILKHGAADDETVVVATGDLTDDAKESQRSQLIAWLLTLKEHVRVLCTRGNHDDAYAGDIFVPESIEPFNRCAGVSGFPTVWHPQTSNAMLIGLDSADVKNLEWFAEGLIGHEQLVGLASLLEIAAEHGRLPIVYLHHHPFCRDVGMPLVDSEDFMRVLGAPRDGPRPVVLFGHRHVSDLWLDYHDIGHFIASGKSTQPDENGILRYRVLTVEGKSTTAIDTEEIAAQTRAA